MRMHIHKSRKKCRITIFLNFLLRKFFQQLFFWCDFSDLAVLSNIDCLIRKNGLSISCNQIFRTDNHPLVPLLFLYFSNTRSPFMLPLLSHSFFNILKCNHFEVYYTCFFKPTQPFSTESVKYFAFFNPFYVQNFIRIHLHFSFYSQHRLTINIKILRFPGLRPKITAADLKKYRGEGTYCAMEMRLKNCGSLC